MSSTGAALPALSQNTFTHKLEVLIQLHLKYNYLHNLETAYTLFCQWTTTSLTSNNYLVLAQWTFHPAAVWLYLHGYWYSQVQKAVQNPTPCRRRPPAFSEGHSFASFSLLNFFTNYNCIRINSTHVHQNEVAELKHNNILPGSKKTHLQTKFICWENNTHIRKFVLAFSCSIQPSLYLCF